MLKNEIEKIEDNYNSNKINSFFVKSITSLVIVITFFVGLLSTFLSAHFINLYNQSCESIRYKFDNVFINIVVVLFLLSIMYFIYNKILKKINEKHLLIFVLLFTFIIGITWVLISKSPVKVDQKMVSVIATEFIANDFHTFENGGYMSYHPLQIGIIFFVELVYKIFGVNSLYFQILNVFFTVGCIYFLYKICNNIFKNELVNKILLIILMGFFHLTLLNVYVYGNLVGLFFSLISVYCTLKYIENKKIYNIFIIALTMAVAIILKSNYEIFLIGIILTLLMDFIKFKKKTNLIGIIIILLVIIFSNSIIIKIMEARLGKEVPKGIPMISYIYMGLNDPKGLSAGWYNGDPDVDVEKNLFINNFDTKKTSYTTKVKLEKRIKEMFLNPVKTTLFFGDKIASTWLEPAFQMIYINKPSEEYESVKNYVDNNKFLISFYDGKINKIVIYYFDALEIIIFGTACFYLFKNKNSINYKNGLLILIFLGGFVFHIIWETKSSYVVIYYILLIPYSAFGLVNIFKMLEEYNILFKIKNIFNKSGGKQNG